MPYVRKLRAVRERRALSQRDLADLAGVSKNTIHRLERGISQVQPRTLRKLARALALEPSELLDESATQVSPKFRRRSVPNWLWSL